MINRFSSVGSKAPFYFKSSGFSRRRHFAKPMLAVAFVFVFWRRLIRQNKVTANEQGLWSGGGFETRLLERLPI
jgi:hypothetical protein